MMKLFESLPTRFSAARTMRSLAHVIALGFLLIGTFGSGFTPARAAEQTYVVQQGDTIAGIAQKFGVPARAIIDANDIEDPDLLYIGQTLIIPTQDAAPQQLPGTTVVVVQPGQSIAQIADAHGVTPREIIDLNHLADGSLIRPGQTLIVPGGRSVPQTSSRGAQLPLPPTPTPAPVATAAPVPAAPARPSGTTRVFKITMYCLQGRMANGEFVHYGAAAADASVLPLGARVYVEGMGTYTIKDRFAVNAGQDRLDLWEGSCASAIQWGVRYVNVTILN